MLRFGRASTGDAGHTNQMTFLFGEEDNDSLFGDANLHSSARGADLFARVVVEGLMSLGASDPLAEYLRPGQR